MHLWGFPGRAVVKNLPAHAEDARDVGGFRPWVRKIPWSRNWQPTPVFLPGKSHGQRNLADYSPWVCKDSDTTDNECAHTHVKRHLNLLRCDYV